MGQTNSYNRSGAGDAGFDFASGGDISGGGVFGVPNAPTRKKFRHPMAVFFHLVFKISAVVIYLFGSAFGSEFLGLFVALVFLISADFWVVKNITGRLLVGLRWWNYIDDEGQSHWVFENRAAMAAAAGGAAGGTSGPGGSQAQADAEFVLFSQSQQEQSSAEANRATGRDATVFWAALFFSPLLWFVFLISAIFSFNIHWVLFVGMALVLSLSNLYGYFRCRFGSNANASSVIGQYVGPKMLFNLMRAGAASQQQQQQPEQTMFQSGKGTTPA